MRERERAPERIFVRLTDDALGYEVAQVEDPQRLAAVEDGWREYLAADAPAPAPVSSEPAGGGDEPRAARERIHAAASAISQAIMREPGLHQHGDDPPSFMACERIAGAALAAAAPARCRTCGGEGAVWIEPPGDRPDPETGEWGVADECPECGGTGAAASPAPAGDGGHRIRLSIDSYGTRAELVCPPSGCEPPVDEGVADESVRCWIETWAEDDLLEYLVGSVVLGEWAIDVEVDEAGTPLVRIAPAAPADGDGLRRALEQIDMLVDPDQPENARRGRPVTEVFDEIEAIAKRALVEASPARPALSELLTSDEARDWLAFRDFRAPYCLLSGREQIALRRALKALAARLSPDRDGGA